MQKIFEEYGGVVQVCIAIVALITIVGLIIGGTNGGLIGESLTGFVASLNGDKQDGIDGPGGGSGGGSLIVTERSGNIMMTFFAVSGDDLEVADEAFVNWAAGIATRAVFDRSYPSSAEVGKDVSRASEVQNPNNIEYVLDISDPSCPVGSVVAYLALEGNEVVLHIAGKDGVVMANEYSLGVFTEVAGLKEVDFNGNYNTADTVIFWGMFANAPDIERLDLSGFDTSNAEDMTAMFGSCSSLKEVNLSSFDTGKVTSMQEMFIACESLGKLDLTSFDTSNVEEMSYMFQYCGNITEILVTEGMWDESNAATDDMFDECGVSAVTYARSVKPNPGVTVPQGTGTLMRFINDEGDGCDEMFAMWAYEATKVVFEKSYNGLSITRDTSLVTVDSGYALDVSVNKDEAVVAYLTKDGSDTVLHIAGKNGVVTANENSQGLFMGLTEVTEFDFNGAFDLSPAVYADAMFADCSSITSLSLNDLNSPNVISVSALFEGCSSLETTELGCFNGAKLKDLSFVFSGCESLRRISFPYIDTSGVTTMERMFWRCKTIKNIDLRGLNSSNVTTMNCMFTGCENLTELYLTTLDTGKVTDMYGMFEGCKSLELVDVSNFNTANVTNMSRMFYGCSSMIELDLTSFNTAKVTTFNFMFNGCREMGFILVGSGWNTSNGTTTSMFTNCGVSTVKVA